MRGKGLPVAPTRRGWGFLVSAAAVGVLWWFAELQDLRYLAALPVAMVVVAVVWVLLLPLLAGFTVRLSVSDPTPAVADRVDCTATVHHRLPVTAHLLVVWDADGRRVSVPLAVGKGQAGTSGLVYPAMRRGPSTIGVSRVEVRDPLGLVVRRVRASSSVRLLVLPVPLTHLPPEVPDAAVHNHRDGTAARRGLAADPGTPGGAVREYRHGDAIRQVHWKQSARHGKLLVNQYDSGATTDARVLLATGEDDYPGAGDIETAVSATVTVTDRLFASGAQVSVLVGQVAPVRCVDGGDVRRLLATATLHPGPADTAHIDALQRRDTVVTGTVSQTLVRELDRAGFSGDVLSTGGDGTGHPWRHTRLADGDNHAGWGGRP
ncbi:MAG: DUF58 domain-containing protein [Mycobacteriaceae bacterium]